MFGYFIVWRCSMDCCHSLQLELATKKAFSKNYIDDVSCMLMDLYSVWTLVKCGFSAMRLEVKSWEGYPWHSHEDMYWWSTLGTVQSLTYSVLSFLSIPRRKNVQLNGSKKRNTMILKHPKCVILLLYHHTFFILCSCIFLSYVWPRIAN